MSNEEATSFIKKAIDTNHAQHWADLGCGSGTFTEALISLLPPGSAITAVDRENQHLNLANVSFVRANFARDALNLSGLDSMLIANAIHYVADKPGLIKKLEPMFSGNPRFVIIEYDTEKPNAWVPFPISFEKLRYVFKALGYRDIVKLNERRSAYNSGKMYCALIEK